jgi:hypothetical protein
MHVHHPGERVEVSRWPTALELFTALLGIAVIPEDLVRSGRLTADEMATDIIDMHYNRVARQSIEELTGMAVTDVKTAVVTLRKVDIVPRTPEIDAWLDALDCNCDFGVAQILCDYLDENTDAPSALVGEARLILTPAGVRQEFKKIQPLLVANYRSRVDVNRSRLNRAKRATVVRFAQLLFPTWYLAKMANAVNAFTLAKIREDDFFARVMPPEKISNERLSMALMAGADRMEVRPLLE